MDGVLPEPLFGVWSPELSESRGIINLWITLVESGTDVDNYLGLWKIAQ